MEFTDTDEEMDKTVEPVQNAQEPAQIPQNVQEEPVNEEPMVVEPPPRMLELTLKSSDGVEITIKEDIACQSNLLRQMITDLQLTPDSPILKEPIPTPNISGETLHRIIDWCILHRGETFVPKPPHEDPRIELTEEDQIWMDVSSDQLMNMLSAANYLDIRGIVEIITQKVADMAAGLTIEELRQTFHLENDFTPEEEAAIKRRFAWIEA